MKTRITKYFTLGYILFRDRLLGEHLFELFEKFCAWFLTVVQWKSLR